MLIIYINGRRFGLKAFIRARFRCVSFQISVYHIRFRCVSFLEEGKLTFGAIVLMDLVHNGTFKVVHHGIFNTRDVIVKQLRGIPKKSFYSSYAYTIE